MIGAQSLADQHNLGGAHKVAEEAVECYEGAAIGGASNTQPPSNPTLQNAHFDLSIAAVGWVALDPNPFQNSTSAALNAQFTEPSWIFKVYMGLVATSNPSPPEFLADPRAIIVSQQFRSLNYARIRITLKANILEPAAVQIIDSYQDPGWTPPFDRNRFPESAVPAAFGSIGLNDREPFRGQKNRSVSSIQVGLHPNNGINISPSEEVVASGLIKFRAGDHTDIVGIMEAGSPWHVPWVWNEFVLTYHDGHYVLHVIASKFPTTWWYINGDLVMRQNQATDAYFPRIDHWSLNSPVDVKKMRIYPILSRGVPSNDPQVSPDVKDAGPITAHPYTVKLESEGTIMADKYVSK